MALGPDLPFSFSPTHTLPPFPYDLSLVLFLYHVPLCLCICVTGRSRVPHELPITQMPRNDFIAKNLRFCAAASRFSRRIRIVKGSRADK